MKAISISAGVRDAFGNAVNTVTIGLRKGIPIMNKVEKSRPRLYKAKKKWLVRVASVVVVLGTGLTLSTQAVSAAEDAHISPPESVLHTHTLKEDAERSTVHEPSHSETVSEGDKPALSDSDNASTATAESPVSASVTAPAVESASPAGEKSESKQPTQTSTEQAAPTAAKAEPQTVQPSEPTQTEQATPPEKAASAATVQGEQPATPSEAETPQEDNHDQPAASEKDNAVSTAAVVDEMSTETADTAPIKEEPTEKSTTATLNTLIPDDHFREQVVAALQKNGVVSTKQDQETIGTQDLSQLTQLQLGDWVTAKSEAGLAEPGVWTAKESVKVADLTGIGNLTGLQSLTLTDNDFTSLPVEINRLAHLQTLKITRNTALTELPDLSELHNLQHLTITNNPQLTTLPASINHLTQLQGELDLKGNSFTTLPDLSQLQQITSLNLNNNRLTDVADAHIEKLTNLQKLAVGSQEDSREINAQGNTFLAEDGDTTNTLFDVVPDQSSNVHLDYDPASQAAHFIRQDKDGQGQYALTNVFPQADRAHYNHLTEVPAAWGVLTHLQALDLKGNDLTELPGVMANMFGLKTLNLGNNQLTTVPLAVENLLQTNPDLHVDLSNYLANYPSFGTYRNQNGIPETEFYHAREQETLPGWQGDKDRALNQVIHYPTHTVDYNDSSFALTGGQVKLADGTKANDSQFLRLADAVYTGPGHFLGQSDADTERVTPYLHFPSQPNGHDITGQYAGLFDATNNTFSLLANDGKNLYPHQDPYGSGHDRYQAIYGQLLDGGYYMGLMLPEKQGGTSHVDQQYVLNLGVGGQHAVTPGGAVGKDNLNFDKAGMMAPDRLGYSQVAVLPIQFIKTPKLADVLPDEKFRTQIEEALKQAKVIGENQSVSVADLKKIRMITLGGKKAVDKVGQVRQADPEKQIMDLAGISTLANLEEMTITDNGFTTLPEELSQLKKLTNLKITRNPNLTALPDLTGLTQLTHLEITNNPQLTELPASINTLTNLTGTLNLAGNSLTTLPDMSQLQKLSGLNLNNNRLTDISQAHLGQLTNLHELALGSVEEQQEINAAGQVRKNEDEGIYDLVPLADSNVHLDYDPANHAGQATLTNAAGEKVYALPAVFTQADRSHYNHLTTLPAEIGQLTQLETLNLKGNDLTDLPDQLVDLTNLKRLNLGNNQLTTVPVAVAKLLASNPNVHVDFSNYLVNYPSYGTYRNQNGIPETAIWNKESSSFVLPGWDLTKDRAVNQVVNFPTQVVDYGQSTRTMNADGAIQLTDGTIANDSQLIPYDTIYQGPGHFSGAVDDDKVYSYHYLVHKGAPNGRDLLGQEAGIYGATNNIVHFKENAHTPYPNHDPYGTDQDKVYAPRKELADGQSVLTVLLPQHHAADGDNVGKTYEMRLDIGGRYPIVAGQPLYNNPPSIDGKNGAINPDKAGYSMVAVVPVTFINTPPVEDVPEATEAESTATPVAADESAGTPVVEEAATDQSSDNDDTPEAVTPVAANDAEESMPTVATDTVSEVADSEMPAETADQTVTEHDVDSKSPASIVVDPNDSAEDQDNREDSPKTEATAEDVVTPDQSEEEMDQTSGHESEEHRHDGDTFAGTLADQASPATSTTVPVEKSPENHEAPEETSEAANDVDKTDHAITSPIEVANNSAAETVAPPVDQVPSSATSEDVPHETISEVRDIRTPGQSGDTKPAETPVPVANPTQDSLQPEMAAHVHSEQSLDQAPAEDEAPDNELALANPDASRDAPQPLPTAPIKASQTAGKLPQTGNFRSLRTVIIGLLLVVLSLMTWRRKHNDQDED
jgi:Leucine-rich repeat (LRR) protein